LTFLWSILEVNTGLICASCLPLKPLYNLLRTSSLFGGKHSRSPSSSPVPEASFPGAPDKKKLLAAREKQNGSVSSDEKLPGSANDDVVRDNGFSYV
jgi:hypothetical protein